MGTVREFAQRESLRSLLNAFPHGSFLSNDPTPNPSDPPDLHPLPLLSPYPLSFPLQATTRVRKTMSPSLSSPPPPLLTLPPPPLQVMMRLKNVKNLDSRRCAQVEGGREERGGGGGHAKVEEGGAE